MKNGNLICARYYEKASENLKGKEKERAIRKALFYASDNIQEYKRIIRKIIPVVLMLTLPIICHAETTKGDYGYYHYQNEIQAKDRIIPHVNSIQDNKNDNESGRYYIETEYRGKKDSNGIDKDYVYLDEIAGKDGKDGIIPEKDLRQIKNNHYSTRVNDGRLQYLEAIQLVVEGNVRVFDSRKWQADVFARYNYTRNKVDTIGARITFKIGKSSAERELDIHKALIEKELEQIKEQLKNQGIFLK